MNKTGFSFRIVSDTSREKVFVEVFYGDDQLAEISQEEEKPLIVFFPPLHSNCWEFPLDEALEAIEEARQSLL